MKKFLMIFLTVCMVISCMIVPSFAAEYPTSGFPPAYDSTWGVKIYYIGTDGVYRGKMINASDAADYLWNSEKNALINSRGSSATYYLIKYDEAVGDWVESGPFQAYPDTGISLDADGLYYSEMDIYDTEGNLFFPPAPLSLTETVEELTMEQSMAVQDQTVGVMKILVPCGVGCLALLMALPTLRKGFLRFLH